jgi:phospholipase/lecithinase/hemolysin
VQQYTNVSLYDYAVSGAVCSSTFSSSKRSGIKEDQIPAFLTDNAFVSNVTLKPALSNPPEETVYAIWIGTNDLGSAVFFTEKQPRTLTIMDYVSCVYDQLDRLYAIGARKFVLMNIAPLDLTPQYALPENGGLINAQYWKDKSSYNANLTQNSEKMREYVALVNAVYDAQTPKYVKISNRYPKSSFAVFDIHSLVCIA